MAGPALIGRSHGRKSEERPREREPTKGKRQVPLLFMFARAALMTFA